MDVIDKAAGLLEADQHTECFEVLTAEVARLRAAMKDAREAINGGDIADALGTISRALAPNTR